MSECGKAAILAGSILYPIHIIFLKKTVPTQRTNSIIAGKAGATVSL